MAEPFLTLIPGPVAHLVLCSPPRNEIGPRFFEELRQLISDEIPRLDPVGLVVRGQGRHFSSGADVEALRKFVSTPTVKRARGRLQRASQALQDLADLSMPVVAAIGGVCLGIGLELALACHFRVATENAVFSLPETTFGLMPGCGGTLRLPAVTGLATAVEWILTGRMVTAKEAHEAGVVDAIVDRHHLLSSAEALTIRLARERAS